MKAPLIVKSDDFAVFSSKEKVEGYFEEWILDYPFSVYDSDGQIINVTLVTRTQKVFFGLFSVDFKVLSLSDSGNFDVEKLKTEVREFMKRVNIPVPADSDTFIQDALKLLSIDE